MEACSEARAGLASGFQAPVSAKTVLRRNLSLLLQISARSYSIWVTSESWQRTPTCSTARNMVAFCKPSFPYSRTCCSLSHLCFGEEPRNNNSGIQYWRSSAGDAFLTHEQDFKGPSNMPNAGPASAIFFSSCQQGKTKTLPKNLQKSSEAEAHIRQRIEHLVAGSTLLT